MAVDAQLGEHTELAATHLALVDQRQKARGSSAWARAAQEGDGVFRRYSGAGGLLEEYEQAARDNRRIAKLVTYGTTINGQRIVALKVTKDPWKSDGARRTRATGPSASNW